jgi:hypothetical protein
VCYYASLLVAAATFFQCVRLLHSVCTLRWVQPDQIQITWLRAAPFSVLVARCIRKARVLPIDLLEAPVDSQG